MAQTGPGKSHRRAISLLELADLFPNEAAAQEWFERARWDGKVRCPHCNSDNVRAVPNAKPMPWRCRAKGCSKHFSVRTGTVMAQSKIPLRKWAFAIYLCATSLKGVSSMKLHRDLNITQKSAWFLAHRIREAFEAEGGLFTGPIEADETWMGGKRKNMPLAKRAYMTGRGTDGKTAVVGTKDRATKQIRARVVEHTDKPTLQGFVVGNAAPGAKVYTDEAKAYHGLPRDHESVNHSVFEYVRGQAHTNGIESFWSMLKRGYQGTFHHFSAKHMQRYVDEFATRQGLRERDTLAIMGEFVARMIGRRLTYRRLIGKAP